MGRATSEGNETKYKDEIPFRYAHAEIPTQMVVICEHYQLDHGGAVMLVGHKLVSFRQILFIQSSFPQIKKIWFLLCAVFDGDPATDSMLSRQEHPDAFWIRQKMLANQDCTPIKLTSPNLNRPMDPKGNEAN